MWLPVQPNRPADKARICAEDPSRNFLPSTGIVTRYSLLRGRDLRLDSGIRAGSQATVYYDSLLAKGIIDSMAVMELVALLEDEFGIAVDDGDIPEEHFGSVSAIARVAMGKARQQRAQPERGAA